MSATFSKRRKEIVGDQPLIGDVIAKWSAMFCERQVKQLDITEPEINNLIQFCLKGYQCVSWLHLSLLCIISMSDTVLFFGGMNVHMCSITEWMKAFHNRQPKLMVISFEYLFCKLLNVVSLCLLRFGQSLKEL